MRITMVGTGYVGLVTGTCLANTGNQVTCLDIDPAKIEALNQGQSPIYEPGLEELIRGNARACRLKFTTDKQLAYQLPEVIFICVGTPDDGDGKADLGYVLSAARDIGHAIETSDGGTAPIIVVKSTVPVGTNALVSQEIAKHTTKPYHMASNPEFLKEGAAINDFLRPDRVVIGVDDATVGRRLRELYEPFVRQGNPILIMDIRSAEMVKYASNAMLATKISFINEMANLCEAYGADIDEVRRGMCSDSRIGRKFLYPGLGYGGSCFPKDVKAVIDMGQQSNTPIPLMSAVDQVNVYQRQAFIAKIDHHFHGQTDTAQSAADLAGPANLTGKIVALWGIAFKPRTDDVREAPSITLIRHLLDRGATVKAYDPVAVGTCKIALGDQADQVEYTASMLAAVEGADALIVCTDWDEFKFPNFVNLKAKMQNAVVFDGRNLYRPDVMQENGFLYYSVGRGPVEPI